MPRHYFIKILKAKGLVKENIDFYYTVCLTEKRFVQKFIEPYDKSIAGLADAYATACAGKMPHEDEVHSQQHARDTEKQRQRQSVHVFSACTLNSLLPNYCAVPWCTPMLATNAAFMC